MKSTYEQRLAQSIESRLVVARALGAGENGMTVNGYGVFLWTDENVLK